MASRPPLAPKSNKTESVKVVVRCRPLNSKERDAAEDQIVNIDKKRRAITIRKPADAAVSSENDGFENKEFTFDNVYAPDTMQQELYDETARPIVDSVLNGYNGTIFACACTLRFILTHSHCNSALPPVALEY